MTKRDEALIEVVTSGNRRRTLEALREVLADELDAAKIAKHRRDCVCLCGIGDARVRVAVAKAIREINAELDELPEAAEVTKLDRLSDDLAARRAVRRTATSGL